MGLRGGPNGPQNRRLRPFESSGVPSPQALRRPETDAAGQPFEPGLCDQPGAVSAVEYLVISRSDERSVTVDEQIEKAESLGHSTQRRRTVAQGKSPIDTYRMLLANSMTGQE